MPAPRNQGAALMEIAETGIRPTTEFRSSDLKNGGSVLDAAERGIVRIRRRNSSYVLIREDSVPGFIEQATDTSPKTFADLLRDFTPDDAADIRARLAGWMTDAPRGRELI